MSTITASPIQAVIALVAAALLGWFACAIVNGSGAEKAEKAMRSYEAHYTEYLAAQEPTELLPHITVRPRVHIGPWLREKLEQLPALLAEAVQQLRQDGRDFLEAIGPDRHEGWQPGELTAARARWDASAFLPIPSTLPVIPTPQQLKFHLVRHVPREIRKQRAERWAR